MLATTNAVVNQAVASSSKNQRRNSQQRALKHSFMQRRKKSAPSGIIRAPLDLSVLILGSSQLPTSSEVKYMKNLGKQTISMGDLSLNDGLDEKKSTDEDEDMLRLNLSGRSFVLMAKNIRQHGPNTLLGRLLARPKQRHHFCHSYLTATDEYYFNRSARLFDVICEYYITGELHCPDSVCFKQFVEEMEFWDINYSALAGCCSPDEHEDEEEVAPLPDVEKLFNGKWAGQIRCKMWLVAEGINSGPMWKCYEFISTVFVMASILGLIIGSLPAMQVHPLNGTVCHSENFKECKDHPVLMYIEYVCVIYFAVDYIVRLIIAPKRVEFAKAFLNAIDLFVIVPCLVEIFFDLYGVNSEQFRKLRWTIITMRVLRVLRVLRIAKLGRFSVGLRNFALTLKRSKSDMEMFAVVLITCVVSFSTLLYFLERDENKTGFTSIPASFWWCVVTMSTVGYGDVVPVTWGGQLVASVSIMCGMIVLAIPITITVNNFMHVSRLQHASLATLAATAPDLTRGRSLKKRTAVIAVANGKSTLNEKLNPTMV